MGDFNEKFSSPYWRAGTVAKAFGIHLNTVWNWTREGILPQPLRIGKGGVTVWEREAVLSAVKASANVAGNVNATERA